jgi:hypothetical protein
MTAKIDAELKRQLAAGTGTIDAAFYVHEFDADASEDVQEVADALIRRVSLAAGEEPEGVNVLLHLRTLIVSASPNYLSILLDQPEIASGLAGAPVPEVRPSVRGDEEGPIPDD